MFRLWNRETRKIKLGRPEKEEVGRRDPRIIGIFEKDQVEPEANNGNSERYEIFGALHFHLQAYADSVISPILTCVGIFEQIVCWERTG